MTALRLGGVNEMVGMGCGIATIMMSSTPFRLANTGGSTRFAAFAAPPPAHKAMITLAAPTDRRSDTSSAVSLLDISFLPALVYVGSCPKRSRGCQDCCLGYRYRECQYRLLQIPVLRVINSKTPLRHYLWPLWAAERTRPT